MAMQLTAAYEKHDDWYVAYIEEIPGVNTHGRTKEEARANLADALELFLEANRDLARQGMAEKVEVSEERFAVVENAA
ncbi:MAG: type II toxin-antitoxin system HicB family antitoxin [Armatimonadetes bacterium]|nr:type II toxin-antitoxin system HicB family antitoxin [Armatimonadota bacterium]